jgi:hypothetical protein
MMVCSSLPNLYWIHHTRPGILWYYKYDSSYPHVDNYFLAYLIGPRIYRWHRRLHQHPTWQPTQWTYSAPSHTDYCILWHIHQHVNSCIVCHQHASKWGL